MESVQGTKGDEKLDELHKNLRTVVENVGHLVTKSQVIIMIPFVIRVIVFDSLCD